MASKGKIDLNSYLTKYAQQGTDLPFSQSQSRYKRNNESFEKMTYTPHQDNQIFTQSPIAHFSGFNKAQNECIQQLQEIRRSLQNQQRNLSFFMQNYSKRLYQNLLLEHNRIREQVLDMLDRSFAQSQKRIHQIVSRQQGNQPSEFINIRKRIHQINTKIEELDHGLRGQNYRKAIAQVVTRDFEGQMQNMELLINNAQKNVLDNATKLIIDEKAFNRLRQDIQALIVTDDKKVINNILAGQINVGANLLANSNARRGSKKGLFDLPNNPPKQSQTLGGFFNFGS